MAGRPINQQRRDELLDAVVGYAVEHSFAELTWRPLATALGVTPTTLVHRFGSKEQMIEAVQTRLRERILTETAPPADEELDLPAYVRRVWDRVADPVRAGEFRLFFAVYGQALQAPESFDDFLSHVIADPVRAFAAVRGRQSVQQATCQATLVIAVLRGLLLDLLTTDDRDRVTGALEAFVAGLEDGGPGLQA
ncbi:TetR/AcrR family transcriptional regulator [Kribbella sp. NPDC048915]|uniref:TetR/AcrR family transcriptional regulator n=1 Tax=Kribbella sp. NPDC048915 TaxID=3155148 RepID=UPI0033C2809F